MIDITTAQLIASTNAMLTAAANRTPRPRRHVGNTTLDRISDAAFALFGAIFCAMAGALVGALLLGTASRSGAASYGP